MTKENAVDADVKNRKALLMGAMAGLAAQSGGVFAEAANVPFRLQDKFLERYTQEAPLWIEDFDRWTKAIEMEKALGIDPVRIRYRTAPYAPGSYYAEGMPYDEIGLRVKSTPTLAHEIGHASQSKIIQPAARFVMGNPLLIPLGLGTSLAMALSENEAAQSWAPAVATLPFVPEIAEEARASIQGARAIKAVEGGKAAAKALAALSPAFLTYLSSTIGPAILAPWLAKKVKEHYEERGHEKTSQENFNPRLRTTSRRAWASPAPTPKTTKPKLYSGYGTVNPDVSSPARPPSKTKYYKDMLESLYNPGRGFRYA